MSYFSALDGTGIPMRGNPIRSSGEEITAPKIAIMAELQQRKKQQRFGRMGSNTGGDCHALV
uniref:Uncharacterized protein n=1 Tax=mine drainage metagenome TaxID=410659 RepID=E6QWE6_9ZZZZ